MYSTQNFKAIDINTTKYGHRILWYEKLDAIKVQTVWDNYKFIRLIDLKNSPPYEKE